MCSRNEITVGMIMCLFVVNGIRAADNFVIDGRLTAYFLPYADLKVFLDCKDKVRAERILIDKRDDEKSKSLKELVKKSLKGDRAVHIYYLYQHHK